MKKDAVSCRRESTTDPTISGSFLVTAMSRNRFIELAVFLRFDDKLSRPVRKETDELAVIRGIWDMFTENCRIALELLENIIR